MHNEENTYNYTPLPEPVPITEQEWPEGTLPLVYTRTMTFNHEKFVRECIEGILMQKTTFPVRVLIHDDASTDKTASIIREYELKYPKLIKACYQPENTYSQSPEMKSKLRRPFFSKWAVGKYTALCEGDDYWIDPLKLQKQVSFLEENDEYGLVHTDCHFYFDKTKILKENGNRNCSNHLVEYENSRDKLFKSIVTSHYKIRTASVVFRNKLNEGLEFEPWFRMGDTPRWLQLSQKTKFKYINEATTVYRVLTNSASKFSNRLEMLRFRMNGAEMRYYYLRKYGYSLDKLKKHYNRTLIELKSFDFDYPQRYALINPTPVEKISCSLIESSILRSLFQCYYGLKNYLIYIKNKFA